MDQANRLRKFMTCITVKSWIRPTDKRH
uniref:Uncharacterized protein n=1 Tax=Arundo donax TaxID=35708 RepID=A0A0A9FY15_ARUDO